MFKELSALLLALPFILALQLSSPSGQVNSSSTLSVSWTLASGTDVSTFDLYLANDVLHSSNELATNVSSSSGSLSVVLPSVPAGDGYSLRATGAGNSGNTLSQTTTFNISNPISSSSLSGSSGISTSSISNSTLSTSSIPRSSTPGTGTSTKTSATNSPTVAFNGNNGALGVTGIGAAAVGLLITAGTFWAL